MKNCALVIILSVFCTTFLLAQETTLTELSPFDKIVIQGDVEEVRLIPTKGESPLIKVKGADKGNISATVVAGTLNLTIKDKGKPARLEVFNDRLKRINGSADMKFTGAEVIGGEAGNYLVVSYDQHHGGPAWAWAGQSFHIHIPDVDIPDVDIPDIPDLPDMPIDVPELNFDFEELHDELRYNWEKHKDEIRHWSQEMNEEMKDAIKKAREDVEKARENMERARKIKESKEE